MSNTLDLDYQAAAERRQREPTPSVGRGTVVNRTMAVAVVLAFGAMVGISALRTQQDKPAAAAERDELVAHIHASQHRLDSLHAQLSDLERGVSNLEVSAAADRTALNGAQSATNELGGVSGSIAVSGPGLRIVTDDAPGAGSVEGGTILDTDLQSLVNALWQAGAEAIAINGHRLTALSAIRVAGSAITVDYRSLTPPYVVEAIGDPNSMQARLLETPGGQAWQSLEANFGIVFDTTLVTNVDLPADPDLSLHVARERPQR